MPDGITSFAVFQFVALKKTPSINKTAILSAPFLFLNLSCYPPLVLLCRQSDRTDIIKARLLAPRMGHTFTINQEIGLCEQKIHCPWTVDMNMDSANSAKIMGEGIYSAKDDKDWLKVFTKSG